MCIDYARSTEKLQLCGFSVTSEVEVWSCRAELKSRSPASAEFEIEDFPNY